MPRHIRETTETSSFCFAHACVSILDIATLKQGFRKLRDALRQADKEQVMSPLGLGPGKLPPLCPKHQFKSVPGIVGGNCVTCQGPITESWHQTVLPISEVVKAAQPHDCIEAHDPHGAPGWHWTCPDCEKCWVAESAGPLDIRWVDARQSAS